MIKTISNY